MNDATVVYLINKCDMPQAKARLAAAYQRACDPETPAEELQTLANREYADTVKVHRAIVSNANVSTETVRGLFQEHSSRFKMQFEVGCGFLLNPAMPFWFIADPGLAWLPSDTLKQLSIIAWAMRDYPKYAKYTSDLERYERVFQRIVEERQEQKEEAA
jgi:hypothetical protein